MVIAYRASSICVYLAPGQHDFSPHGSLPDSAVIDRITDDSCDSRTFGTGSEIIEMMAALQLGPCGGRSPAALAKERGACGQSCGIIGIARSGFIPAHLVPAQL